MHNLLINNYFYLEFIMHLTFMDHISIVYNKKKNMYCEKHKFTFMHVLQVCKKIKFPVAYMPVHVIVFTPGM